MGLFYNPYDFGEDLDLAISQVESLLFSFDAEVVTPKIVAFYGTKKIIEYTEGNGLTVNQARSEVTWALKGEDYKNHPGQKVSVEMSFFVEGAVEYVMKINIKDSRL